MLGVLLGFTLRGTGICAVAFGAIHVLQLWLNVLIRHVRACMYKRDLKSFTERNHAFLNETAATSAPRHAIPKGSTYSNMMLALVGGLCDGFAIVLMPTSNSDAYVLSLAAVLLCHSHTRWMPGVAFVYVMLTTSLPRLHNILRACCLLTGTVLSHGYTNATWRLVRVAIGTTVLVVYGGQCVSKGIPPVLLLAFALYSMRCNPALVLTFAALVVL